MSEPQIIEKNQIDTDTVEESILREILATPFVKDMLRNHLNGIKPENGKSFARTLIWQDMEFLFSIIAALPLIINSVINAVHETGEQLNDKITPELLREYLGNVLSDIDTETLKEGFSLYGELIRKQLESDEVKQSITQALEENLASGLGRSINSSLVMINRIQDENPELITGIIQKISINIDNSEFKKTVMGILNPVLDRISYFKLIRHLTASRIIHRFKRKRRRR